MAPHVENLLLPANTSIVYVLHQDLECFHQHPEPSFSKYLATSIGKYQPTSAEELTQDSRKLCYGCRAACRGRGIQVLGRGRGSDYRGAQESCHTLTIIGAVGAEQQTCSSGVTSTLTEHKPATLHSEERPGRGKIHPGRARVDLLLANAGQGIPCLSRGGVE